MRLVPYEWQAKAAQHAVGVLRSGGKQLYAAPTGCGKSVVELMVQEATGAYIVTPRVEIIDGMIAKGGDRDRICTPVKLRNALLKGATPPTALVFDEGHHHNAETWQQLDLLTGLAPSVAYTATPYRGSPRSTRELREHWGDPRWLITYEEAVAEGYVSMPTFSMLPLVDDDVVDVRGGEFDVLSLDAATVDRLGDMADHARCWYSERWDRATIFALPSSTACLRLQKELLQRGLPCTTVAAGTPREQRQQAFAAAAAGVLALLHIDIVSEGVDLPLRRLVDLAPTLSPVRWVQQLGRVTRPSPEPPEYVCTNRNLLRHCYALEGVVPVSAAVAAEQAFPRTERAHVRVLGLEAIGRFKPTSVELLSGLRLSVYSLSTLFNGVVAEFVCVVHPSMEPVWATKVSNRETKRYGTWRQCDPPEDLRGFASLGGSSLSEKQRGWWRRSAARYGLSPEQDLTRKSFQVLPVLADLGLRMR
jgi:hypothetical protein